MNAVKRRFFRSKIDQIFDLRQISDDPNFFSSIFSDRELTLYFLELTLLEIQLNSGVNNFFETDFGIQSFEQSLVHIAIRLHQNQSQSVFVGKKQKILPIQENNSKEKQKKSTLFHESQSGEQDDRSFHLNNANIVNELDLLESSVQRSDSINIISSLIEEYRSRASQKTNGQKFKWQTPAFLVSNALLILLLVFGTKVYFSVKNDTAFRSIMPSVVHSIDETNTEYRSSNKPIPFKIVRNDIHNTPSDLSQDQNIGSEKERFGNTDSLVKNSPDSIPPRNNSKLINDLASEAPQKTIIDSFDTQDTFLEKYTDYLPLALFSPKLACYLQAFNQDTKEQTSDPESIVADFSVSKQANQKQPPFKETINIDADKLVSCFIKLHFIPVNIDTDL